VEWERGRWAVVFGRSAIRRRSLSSARSLAARVGGVVRHWRRLPEAPYDGLWVKP
jgi:hypothetical protein